MKKIVVVLLALFALTTFSCEVGLGSAVDIYVPTVGISYPPKNAVVRDTFVAAGECNDDMGLSKVEVSLFNPETGKTYGPYDATISDDAKSWSVSLNKSDSSKTTNVFDSYKQWEIPDGNYIISAIAYDNANKNSQTATSPIAIDNTAPVLIISKPLATGNETATVYGRSLKLTGDIAEEHETSKLILNYKQYDGSQGDFIDTEVKTLVLNDSAELTAMSSSNPLVIAKYDENKPDSEQHKNYLKLYGNTADDVDRYYYSGILIEDNARIYNAPGDNGSGTGNQTQQYYLLSQAFSKDLAVNYSLTAPRLMEILRGENGSYTTEHLSHIEEVLTTQGNFASSVALSKLDDEALAKAQSSKFSLNPHNNPTWTLDEYGISEPAAGATTFQEVKAYTAGSSLILSLRAGRDASYPDPKTVKLSLYNLGNYNSTVDYYNYDITNITPVVLIDPDGSTKWNESADDSEKTKTFTLSTDDDGLIANYVYRVVVEGTDRNRVDLEPEGDNVYVFKVTSSNNIPTVTITENLDGKVFGTAVNTTGVTVKGYVKTDGIALDQTKPITVSDFTIKNMDGTSAGTKDDYHLSPVGNPVDDPDGTPNKYWFEILVKANSGKVFVPSTQSKYLYTITVKAKDAGQNEGTKNAKFYVDNLPPTVTEPTVSPVVNIVENSVSKEYVNGKLKVSGTASDSGKTGSGLKSIEWKITKSGEATPVASDTIAGAPENWEFEIPTKNFEDNNNYIITVTAKDIVDNEYEVTKTISLKQSTDTPVLTLKNAKSTIDAQNKLVSASTNMFNTSGNNKLYILVKDDDGLKSVTLKQQKAGATTATTINPVVPLTAEVKEYNAEYVLPNAQGEYKITVEAIDIYAAGSDSSRESSYDTLTESKSAFWITIDNGAPVFEDVIATTNPLDSGWYLGSTDSVPKTLTIKGKVTDANGLKQDGFTVKHYKMNDDETWPTEPDSSSTKSVSSGSFEDTITLPKASGTYKVVYTAKDKYDQESSAEIEYKVDIDKPEIKNDDIKIDNQTVSSNTVTNYIKDTNVEVSVNVKDTGSDVTKVEYSLDSGATWKSMVISGANAPTGYDNWSSSVTFDDGETQKLRLRVTDGVGLTALYPASGDITLKVDKTDPVMGLKWYQIEGDTALSQVSGTAYVNSKDLIIYANYTDGTSGVKAPEFKIVKSDDTEATLTPTLTYYDAAFDTAPATGTGAALSKNTKAYKAVISAASLVDGDLYIKGSDNAGNTIRGEWVKALSIEKDTTAPNVGAITLTKAYQKNGTYYVRKSKDGNLVVTGTTTDDHKVDKTVLNVPGLSIQPDPSSAMNWSFSLDLSSLTADPTITVTAYDKAGNASTPISISVVFDDKAPMVLTGKYYSAGGISDDDDESNPYIASYTKRGDTVYKYGNLKIGAGDYSDSSYGRESQIPITVTFVGDEAVDNGSGIATIEYKMIKASKVPADLKNTTTGKFTGTIPTISETNGSSGNFEVSHSTYNHFKETPSVDYDCTIGTATINGFEPTTTNGTPNLVFVQATDNCGNKSDWFAILVQLDDEKPEITLDTNNPSSVLTNGKSAITTTLKGSMEDSAAGLKAARIYVDGKLAIDGCLKGLNNSNTVYDETDKILYVPSKNNATLKISAKNASGTSINPLTNTSENEAVEVTFQNDYGTFKYFPPEGTQNTDKHSFANSATSAKWELNLTPQEGTWFDGIKTKQNPQITIEVEDWAEDSSGSGNKNTDLITTLDIDIKPPKISILRPAGTATLNGTHTIKASVEEEHSTASVEIYYSTETDPPAALTEWTQLKSEGSVYEIQEDLDLSSTEIIAQDTATGTVHVLVYATDESGNSNVPDNNVIADQADSAGKAYKTINIDKNTDRPTVTIKNIELVGNDGTGTDKPLSSTNWRKHETKNLSFSVEDDDGIAKFEYRITKDGEDSSDDEWKEITNLVQNSGSILFTNDAGTPSDGKQKIEFRITDNDGGEFLSDTTDDLKRIYLKDLATPAHKYGLSDSEDGYVATYATPIVYLNVDQQSPKVAIKGITPLKVSDGTGTEITGNYSSESLGGPDRQYVKVRIEAEDEGTGVNTVAVTATLDGNTVTVTPATLTAEADGKTYYCVIPCFDTGTKKDNKPLSISVTATDNVNKQSSDSLILKVDDNAPQISITAPSSTETISGSVTAQATITNKESAKLYYAISPIATLPHAYAENQTFTFVKNGDTANPVTLPTTAKDGTTTITPEDAEGNEIVLKDLCSWKSLDPNDAMLMNFYLWLDGKANDPSTASYHTDTLNKWILNMGITTIDDLTDTDDPFNDIVQLYVHIKAVDAAGNINYASQPISVDPLGKRPKVNVAYPTVPEANSKLTLGGTPSVMGTVEGANVVDYVWMQLDCTGDKQWTADDFNKLAALKNGNDPVYTLGNMKTKLVGITAVDANNPIKNLAIRISLSGLSWSQKINLKNELYPTASGVTAQDSKIWVYATDNQGFISETVEREFEMDSDSPLIDQNLYLVQWNTNFDGDNGIDYTKTDITFKSGAVKASRMYQENLNIKGKWYLIGKAYDSSNGLHNISYSVKNKDIVYPSVTAVGETPDNTGYSVTTTSQYNTGTYIKPSTTNNKIYFFCLPVGDETADAVGEYSVEFSAVENKSGGTQVKRTFKVRYDNLAPVIEKTFANDFVITNSNGTYKLTAQASERNVGNVEQTGVERVAFFFTRNITGQATKVFDPMIRSKKNGTPVPGNAVDYSGLGALEDGLYWQTATVSSQTGSAVTFNASTAVLANIHKGGLAKIAGVIYRIEDVSGSTVTLSETPGTDNQIKFALACVVDNPTRESPGTTTLSTNYPYGYTPGDSFEDGDYMIEGLSPDSSDNKVYIWEASINSKNISDGPAQLHYVVFDKAGNTKIADVVNCSIKNNAPRLAGVKLGTDEDGSNAIEDGEFVSYHELYPQGYNDGKNVSSLTIPAGATAQSPVSVFAIKGKTVIKPEIVGGNGAVGYTYSVAAYNNAQNDEEKGWNTPVNKVTTPVDLGTGTEAEDDLTVDLTESGGITITVEDLLTAPYIKDGSYQKFSFTIWDSTPGLVYGSTSQKATLNIIMDVALDDKEPAKNKIIPFYWKSKTENSLKDNDSKLGHIDLSKDLPRETFKASDEEGYDATTIYTLNPKISGAVKLEGIAQDNSLLKSLSVEIDDTTYQILTYASGTWTKKNETSWSSDYKHSTYDELLAAGYITQARYEELTAAGTGINGTDEVPYASQEFGHVVHWIMNIDTQAMSLTPKAGIKISVSAADKGTPYTNGTGAQDGQRVPRPFVNNKASYGSNTFKAVTGQTGGNNGTSTQTSEYTVDLVPYITRIKTALSAKSSKEDTSEYDRTALGHYPVKEGETIVIEGFNLGGKVKFKTSTATVEANYDAAGVAIPETAVSGEISIVNGVESLNNKNKNDAKGSYTGADPVLANYGKSATYNTWNTYYYNRKPNTVNNYTLTDNTVLDIWHFNNNAAQSNPTGRVDEPIMKINPKSNIIGFAFLSGSMHYSMPSKMNNSYSGEMEGRPDGDYHAGNGFTYDSAGNAYAIECGGDEASVADTPDHNAPYYVHFVTTNGTHTKNYIDMNWEGGLVQRYKLKSASLAATVHGTNRNLYMAYYNSYNSEIRFRSGSSNNNWGLFNNSCFDDRNTTRHNSQVIACDPAMANIDKYNNGGDNSISAQPLGNAGEFVAIDVITGTTQNNDVVVLVWYDGKDLWYTYNTEPLKTEWRNRNNVDDEYEGLNRRYWKNATKIFEGAGEYCQVKVDGQKHIHIAAFDSKNGDVKYAYMSSYSDTANVATYTVDSAGNTGSHLLMDVALDSDNNPIPYISYASANRPKLAFLVNTSRGDGALSEMFTGNWEVTYIPTDSSVIDMDAKKLQNIDSRVNVGVWKDTNGKIKDSQAATGKDSENNNRENNASATTGTCWGNGTANPVVGYQIAYDDSNDRIETAQMK